MKKIIISLLVLLGNITIEAGVVDAALNSESTPFLSPEGGQTVTTAFTGIDPDNPDPAKSTYNFTMDYGRQERVTNRSSYNNMWRPWGMSNY